MARRPEFQDVEIEENSVGYDETLPGQIEVVAGSVEHEQLLNSFANATSYGPEHNVVVPVEEPPPPPPEGSGDPQMVAAEREYGR